MGQIIDSCVWIDHLRKGTSEATRRVADAAVNEPDAFLCEPVRFELLSGASRRERPLLLPRLATMPLLQTPQALWAEASKLASQAYDSGLKIPSIDLLIVALCLLHKATLTTFDSHFTQVARFTPLKVNLLIRPD